MRRLRTLLLALLALVVSGEAMAHLDPEARTRTFVLDRGETALVLYARVPAPLVFARTIAARQAGETPPAMPFLTSHATERGVMTVFDLAAVAADEAGFARLAASGYGLTVDGVPAEALEVRARVRGLGALPPFLTPAQAAAAVAAPSSDAHDPLFIGDAHVDLAMRFAAAPSTAVLTLQATLPELVLPPGLYVDNHIVDVGPDATASREIVGQLLAPVTLAPPAPSWWQLDLGRLVAEGTTASGLLVVLALVLGALHALEPGHAKTMMAAFVIAVNGTPLQAVVLGLSAAVAHSILVVVLGVVGLTLAPELDAVAMAPLMSIVSGLAILVVAGFTLRPLLRQRPVLAAAGHGHHHHHHADLDEDAHARAHARDIEHRFQDGRATMRQVVAFGFAGGLVPCGAALTVLILCLQLDRLWLGLGLLGAFSAGLALTLTATGLAASIGLRRARGRSAAVDAVIGAAPLVSGLLIAAIGIAMVAAGVYGLGAAGRGLWP